MNWIEELRASPRSWSEDFTHENGNYFNNCIECDNQFMGHKRRVVCKVCSEREEYLKENPPFSGPYK